MTSEDLLWVGLRVEETDADEEVEDVRGGIHLLVDREQLPSLANTPW